MFPTRVERGVDGAYYWTYDLKANGNNTPFWFMVKVCLAVSLPIALIMLVLTWQYGPVEALLYTLLLLVLMVGLPMFIWQLMPVNPSFRMDEEAIEAWPKGSGVNIHTYRGVRRVIMEREIDRIHLRWRVGGLHVYVPREDYEMVREFILAHVPEGAERVY